MYVLLPVHLVLVLALLALRIVLAIRDLCIACIRPMCRIACSTPTIAQGPIVGVPGTTAAFPPWLLR